MINRLNVIAGTAYKILGRAKISSGAWATASNVTQIDATIRRMGAVTPTLDAELTPVATYVLNALATSEPNWTEDTNDDRTEAGYNFLWLIPASAFPLEGWYTVEVLFSDSDGVTKLLWEVSAWGTLGTVPAGS